MRNRTQLNWLQKMWFDTVTNPVNGEYSQKRLMKWGGYLMACFLSLADVVELHFSGGFDIAVRRPDTTIVGLWMAYAFVESAAIIAGKYMNRKTTDDNGNPLEPAIPEPLKNTANE